jgi:hypothetical protein
MGGLQIPLDWRKPSWNKHMLAKVDAMLNRFNTGNIAALVRTSIPARKKQPSRHDGHPKVTYNRYLPLVA